MNKETPITSQSERPFQIECNTGKEWIAFLCKETLEEAMAVANFMRLSEPRPESVRIFNKNTKEIL